MITPMHRAWGLTLAAARLTAFTQAPTSTLHPPAIQALTVSPTSLTLRVAETGTIKKAIYKSAPAVLAPITFTSSDTSIARVDSTGRVTAIKPGTATVTVNTAAAASAGLAAARLTSIIRVDVIAAKSP